jgi:hypothetical protein
VDASEKHANLASIHRLWLHSVAVLNYVQTVGTDPITKQKMRTEEPGSACALLWGSQPCIVTAAHVVENAELKDLGFFGCSNASLEERSAVDIRPENIFRAEPLRDPNAKLYRCEWEDLAVISVESKFFPKLEFFDVSEEWIDPPSGEIVSCFGFPSANNLELGRRRIGEDLDVMLALYATAHSVKVQPMPTTERHKFKLKDFNPEHHYLVSFESANDGIHPRGLSGSGMWWEKEKHEMIWRANFKFAGINFAAWEKGSTLGTIKASVVCRFLEETFGALH